MRNPLQEQLLKAGLVKKGQVAQVVREQVKQRHGKTPAGPPPEQVDGHQLRADRAERDRALAAERNAQARAHEVRAQARQLVEAHRVVPGGDAPYRFNDAGGIRSIHVDAAQRALLAKGSLVVVRHGDGYALLPRAAADKVLDRDAALVVVDHGAGGPAPAPAADPDDAYYQRFTVPDDLVW